MAVLFISDRFYQAPEVISVSNRAIGAWIGLASYHATFPEYDIPWIVAKKVGARPKDIKELTEYEWLLDGGRGWRLGHAEVGLWKIGNVSEGRPSRPKIPQALRDLVMERDEYTCQECGATENLSLDHILPFSFGGPDTEENLRVLCRRCNSSRGNRVEVDA